MAELHTLDILAMAIYFVILLWIGVRVARSEHGGETESFLAAGRSMNLVQTTASTAATDLGGGFSIAMGGLGFTLGISGSWLIAISGLSIVMVSFLMVPKVKRWADKVNGLTTGDLFEARFDRRTGTLAALVIGLAWFTFVGGQIIAGAKLLQVTVGMGLTAAVVLSGRNRARLHGNGRPQSRDLHRRLSDVRIADRRHLHCRADRPLQGRRLGRHCRALYGAILQHASLVDWGAVGWKRIVGWFLAIFPIWFISIAAMQRIVAARDEKTARRAFLLTGVPIEWPLFAIGSTLIGMIARMLLPDVSDPELATPMIILEAAARGYRGHRNRSLRRGRHVDRRLSAHGSRCDFHQ